MKEMKFCCVILQFDHVCSVKFYVCLFSGLGGKLLEQKIPLSYLHLQEVVCVLAKERTQLQKDPVLFGGQYKYYHTLYISIQWFQTA